MARNIIKGLTVEIGGDTTKLGKALEDVNKESRSLSSELGDINRLLKLDPSNTELLAQKQKVLSDAISNTEEKLNTLREAERQVQAQFEKGEVSEAQYRELRREIMDTEKRLDGYKKAAEETAQASRDLADGANTASGKLNNAAGSAKDADKTISKLGSGLATAAKKGLGALVGAATATIGSLVALAESTREYRTEMGKLDADFAASSFSSDTAKKAYKSLQGVIGETDQSVEAAQQIALLAEAEEDVAEWADLAAGVVGTFGDALQPETFYEAANETLKLGEATGAYVQMLEGTGHDVEEFNEGLADCNTEAEKQEYLLKVTKKALGQAGDAYKKNNKEVIRSNKATDDWNEALAKMGKHVEPVMTDIKELGISLIENAEEPLKKVADFVRNQFLPALTNIGRWVGQNIPTISAVIAGVTGVIVAHKIAVLSAEAATKGLTLATLAHQAAQKTLNTIMAGSPWGLVATAIAGVATALVTFALASKNEAEPRLDALTEKERDLMAAANDAATAFEDQQSSTQNAMGAALSEMFHVQELVKELQSLADASGNVKEKDQERANFILGKLSEATGQEWTMVDGTIQKYDTLVGTVDELIRAKTANALLEAGNAEYVTAIQNEGQAYTNAQLAQKDYLDQKEYVDKREAELAELQAQRAELAKKARADATQDSYRELYALDREIGAKREALDKEKIILDEKQTAYSDSAAQYEEYKNTIQNYREAEEAAAKGNYELVTQLLVDKGAAYNDYSDKVDEETREVLNTLQKEAVDAGVEAKRTKENFEKGVEGYTQEMVDEAETNYQEALNAFATAYADAEAVGGDLSKGLQTGMESRRSTLFQKARGIVSGIISAMRNEADSHSPAKKTIDFGEDVGEGAEIGIENKTEDVKRAATKQAAAILDAYSSQEITGQNALRHVSERQASIQTNAQAAAAAQNNSVLYKILAAIEHGQVLTIDGKTLVGKTADMTDTALGQRRALVARGAI